MSLLIVGSLALDTIETPYGRADDALGGSGVFAAYAASPFTAPSVVGVVGDDFPDDAIAGLQAKGVDTEGVEIVAGGKTFRWGGRYLEDINQRETLFTDLNVFNDFQPKLPEAYRACTDLFLANINPELQLDTLEQMESPRLVVCDTMNLWIDIKRDMLLKLLKKIDVLLLNDEEARMLAKTPSLIRAAGVIRELGVERVLIKKGEHGCMMFGPEGVFASPALPVEKVVDPTGAGDSFAGGMLGWLDGRALTPENWRKAIVIGTATASFAVEDFSVNRLRDLTRETVVERAETLREMMSVGEI